MRLRWFLTIIFAGAVACGRHDPVEATAAAAEHRLTPEQLGFLKFGLVAEVDAATLSDVNGTIEFDEDRTARLNAPLPGRVVELLVTAGDRVEADQPLLVLDSPEVKSAQAEYIRAEADERLARAAAARAERLHAAHAVAEKDYQQAREEAHKTAADFERARAQLERLRIAPGDRTSRYVLRSPLAGTVVERRALVGMEAGAESGEPLVVVSDLSRVRVVVRLPERQLALARPGQAVGVRVDAYGDEFPGAVSAVGDVVDEATRTVPVRCAVANPNHLLKPAMFARVSLKAPPGLHLLVVPSGALVSDGQRFRVFVRRADGSLDPRAVEVGAEIDGQVQVISGLQIGEEVVVEGALFAARELATS